MSKMFDTANKPRQLHHFFENSVDRFPNNIALNCDGEQWTYQSLEQKTNQLAHHLLQQGFQPGDTIAILIERSANVYIAILAALKIGATYVPIEVEYPSERINYILSDIPFRAVITTSTQARREGLNIPEAVILDELAASLQQQSLERPVVALSKHAAENTCYIIYTSGSTGKPKGVEVSHSSICHYISVASDIYAMVPEDRVYQGFSLAFDASLEEVWMALANGATLIACTDRDIRSGVGLIDFLVQNRVSVLSTVPTLLANLNETYDGLRLLILGGELCPQALVNRWISKKTRIINSYGPTEATVIATYSECTPDKPVSIGMPLPGYDICLLDDHLKPVPDGEVGELCIGGQGLAKGYINRPEMTEAKFIQNPSNKDQRLYRTGDLAFIQPNGEIQYVGRADDQIKLRGFRIELNEIENVILEFPGVNQAVVALQTLNKPFLVAYYVAHNKEGFNLEDLKAYLRNKLPDYMMPALFEELAELPCLASGKVDRKMLPIPTLVSRDEEYVQPGTPLEEELAHIWEAAFKESSISVTADFFYDLGGHSLLAANVVSALRKDQRFKTVSILDLYQNPTIRQLAKKLEPLLHINEEKNKAESGKLYVSRWKHAFCGAAQFIGCLLQYALNVWQLLLFAVFYYWLTEGKGFSAVDSMAMVVLFSLFLPVLTASIAIIAKWSLLGRVKPGKYPLWGWFYLRWWFVKRLQQNVFEPKNLQGTPLMNWYLRLLGANIGRGCYIATTDISVPDLFSMGDDSSIGQDVKALGYHVEDGWLHIGSITLGERCFVGSRAVINLNTFMDDDSALEEMSLLPRNAVISKQQFFAGSPAQLIKTPAYYNAAVQIQPKQDSLLQSANYGLLQYFGLIFIKTVNYISFLPSLFILDSLYEYYGLAVTLIAGAPFAAALYLGVYLTNLCIVKHLLIGKSKQGTYALNSIYYLRQWLLMRLLDVDEVGVLADSLYFPMLLKLLGTDLGYRVEMGEAPHLLPDLLTIEEGGFTASGVAIGWPRVYKGYVTFESVRIGKKAFVGNASLLPLGSNIGDGALLGCMSVPPLDNNTCDPDSAWLGSPPVFLPVREKMDDFPDELTFNPSAKTYKNRLLVELFRVILPTTCSLILLCSLCSVLDYLLTNGSISEAVVMLPVADMLLNLGIVGGLILLKWVLLGRIKPSIVPLWDSFIWKNDIREFSYGYYISPHVTNIVLGTPFIAMLFRAMGAKIGKRSFIDTEGFAEFDLIEIGDDVCINKDTLIQTHLYEDRIFKLAPLCIKDGCNVGANSMVLYNTVMENNSSLGSFSLLMKGEILPENTNWEGCPAQSVVTSQASVVSSAAMEAQELYE